MNPIHGNSAIPLDALPIHGLDAFRQAHKGTFRRSGPNSDATNCPACQPGEIHKHALSVTEGHDGRLLAHCFKGCSFADILHAVNLSMAEVMPVRHWPDSPRERVKRRTQLAQVTWESALKIAGEESTVALIAAQMTANGELLDIGDRERLSLAVDRLDKARQILDRGYFQTLDQLRKRRYESAEGIHA